VRKRAPAENQGVTMAVPVEQGPGAHGPRIRMLNVVLGVWLFVSAFLWPHTHAQEVNTLVVGALCVIFGIASTTLPWVRHLSLILAFWLFISALSLPSENVGTVWNNALVAIGIFVVSLMGQDRAPAGPSSTGPPIPPRAL
jgi:nitric oxide reductase large subunit